MVKCLRFFQDQFQSSFPSQSKDDSSMNSTKDSEENNSVIAVEGQDPEDIKSENLDIQEEQMDIFCASLNEDLAKKKGCTP